MTDGAAASDTARTGGARGRRTKDYPSRSRASGARGIAVHPPGGNVLSQAQALEPWLREVRRELHRWPELGHQEMRTTARLQQWLAEAGILPRQLGLATGAVADVVGDADGPVVGLRADIDALPIQEGDTPTRRLGCGSQQPGTMHACGHDFHAAALLGAARLLAAARETLPGSVRLLFQPAEEPGTGAAAMLAAGALDHPAVGMIFGLHCYPGLPAGQIGVAAGPLMAAVDTLDITLAGEGGHGALPHRTADPITAAGAVISALQTVVSRRIDPLSTAVVSIGVVRAGTDRNSIPDEVLLQGTIRSFEPEVRRRVHEAVRALAAGVAAGYGVAADVQMTPQAPPVVNDPRAAELAGAAARAVLGPGQVMPAQRVMGGEDFAHYLERVPGCLVWIGTGNAAAGIVHPWHHHAFDVDESALPVAAAVLAETARRALHRLTDGRSSPGTTRRGGRG